MANSISSSSSSSNPIPNSKTTINDLPQHILIYILSFLYIQDAIGTSLISRSFRNLWHLIPSLHFDLFEFYKRSTSPTPRCDLSRDLFVEFVSKTLIFRQHNPLTKLKFTFEYTRYDVHKNDVQSWIRYAINISVSELVIDFREEDKFDKWKDPDDDSESEDYQEDRLCEFDFYLSDIAKSRIKILKLYKCEPVFPPKTSPVKFISLKSLTIAHILVIDGKDVTNLLARCVNLEILTLARMSFFAKEGLVIRSWTLKELNLFLCAKFDGERLDLDICCPSLQKISIERSVLPKCINKYTTHLVEAYIDFRPLYAKESYIESWERMFSYFTNITSIYVWDELLESNEVPAGCERFASNVKHLELQCYYTEFDLVGIAALLKLLPKLEILVLSYNGDGKINESLDRDYRKASTIFSMPCLKKLILRRYRKTKMEKHFIKLFKKNGIVLDKIELLAPNNQNEYDKY